MQFKIGDFRFYTKKITEQSNEQIAIPTTIKFGKPTEYEMQYKTREITVFSALALLEKEDGKYYKVIDDVFELIDFIELLKAFIGNKLITKKTYKIGDSFTATTATKNGNMSLSILFTGYSSKLYLDKFECSSLAAKFSKILQRCEAWQEQEV